MKEVYIVLRGLGQYIEIGPYRSVHDAGRHRNMLVRRFPLQKHRMAMVVLARHVGHICGFDQHPAGGTQVFLRRD